MSLIDDVKVRVTRLKEGAKLPIYMSDGASGSDVFACLEKPLTMKPMERLAVPTGIKMEIPPGFEIQVRPRSGFAIKKGLTVVNAPGTIDSDFRGEVQILMINLGELPVEIVPGDRIAQLVLQKVERAGWEEASELTLTARNEGGFGSTGFTKNV